MSDPAVATEAVAPSSPAAPAAAVEDAHSPDATPNGVRSRKQRGTQGADGVEEELPAKAASNVTDGVPAAAAAANTAGLALNKKPTERRHSASAVPSASSSSSSSASSSTSSSQKTGPQGHWGFTAAGDRFDVPDTLNTTEIFLPQNLSLGSALSGTLFLTAAWMTFCGDFSVWVHVCIFAFWRLCYDLGLGLILRAQSEHKSFQKFYLRHYNAGGWKAQLLDHLAVRQLQRSVRLDPSRPIQSYPQEFRAWLVYKNLVNIILVNDGLTYLLLWWKCFQFPHTWDLLVVAQYALGIFLGVFNYWAKVDAHRCIGEYCWYWGDFFFRKDLHLTFDGIFELFPHPMYTVGYALYYGASLMARSYTLLFVSMLAHGAQLAFLFFVEEPHIKRTYGSSAPLDKSKLRVLYDPKSGWFPDKADNVFLMDVDLFRSGDLAVVLFCFYSILLAFLPSNPTWALGQAVAWRIVHWIGLGGVLWLQSRYQTWTKHFTNRGRTTYEAFGHWKNTYNLSLTLNLVTFLLASIRFFLIEFQWGHLLSPSYMACFAVGCVLISLSVWSFLSTWEAVGEFGWFYGDFFISESSFRTQLCYTGIYRFLNNPDAVTGYAGLYGCALMAQSWEVFGLALGSHMMNVIFLHLVEAPHMSRLYSEKEVRHESPFPRALKKMGAQVKEKTREVPEVLKRLKEVAREATSPSPSPSHSPVPSMSRGSSAE